MGIITGGSASSGGSGGGGGPSDHGALTGRADDDHTQYGLLAGRAAGQTLIGGTAASDDLTLQSTSDATRGGIICSDSVLLGDDNQLRFGGSVAVPDALLEWNTADETNDTLKLGLGNTSHRLIICDAADIGVDSALGNATDPTLTILSSDGVGAERLDLSIDATGTGVIDVAGVDLEIRTAGINRLQVGANFARVRDNTQLQFGNSADAALEWDTGETNDHLKLGLPIATNARLLITDDAVIGEDSALAAATVPTLSMHSGASAAYAQRVDISHDGTDALITPVTGDLIVAPVGGDLVVRQSGGVAGTDEVRIRHNGVNTLIDGRSGSMFLMLGGVSEVELGSARINFLGNLVAGSDASGGDLVFESTSSPTRGDVVVTNADALIVRQTGGVAGTDEVQIRHNGTDGVIDTRSGVLQLHLGGVLEYSISSTGLNLIGNRLRGSNVSGGDLTLEASSNATKGAVTIPDSSQGLKIGGVTDRAGTEGTNQLVLFDGTAPTSTLANGASLYSAAGEMTVMDASGNDTIISPHDEDGNWIFRSRHSVTGRELRVDMEKLVTALDCDLGYNFVSDSSAQPSQAQPGRIAQLEDRIAQLEARLTA